MKLHADLNRTQFWRLSIIRKGIWWWADDADNPFGYALLACPRISNTRRIGSFVYLYTLDEASSWTYPQLIARERSSSPLSKVGWVIYHDKHNTKWTLPGRLLPEVSVKLIRKNIVKYNNRLKSFNAKRG